MDNTNMTPSLSYFTDAVLAYHQQAFDDALRLAELALDKAPHNLLFRQAVLFLQRIVEQERVDVYVSPKGFEKFIRGGGNLPLYANTSALLKGYYEAGEAATLLDIGVGDGFALLPALSSNVVSLDLVEPSAAMLGKLVAAVEQKGFAYRAHPMRWQRFRDEIAAQAESRVWDMIEMTFSAHTFLPDERPELLAWCADRCKRFALVEFDVPLFADMLAPEVIEYYIAKYEAGLAEYRDEEIVMQGFLMPVFFGNFAHNSERVTFEQPSDRWEADLAQAGFSSIEKLPVYDYWWAPAFMLRADGKRT